MPEYLAPGVYVEEVSFRSKSIEGVSTSTAGFIGPARFGPITGRPELLTSQADFERIFGDDADLTFSGGSGPVPNYLAHAVRGFFDEGGRRLYVTRVFRYAPTPPAPDANGRTTSGHASIPVPPRASPPGPPITIRARFPGLAGQVSVIFTLKVGRNALSGAPGSRSLTRVREFDVVWAGGGSPITGDLRVVRRDAGTQQVVLRDSGGSSLQLDDPAVADVRLLTVVVEVSRPTTNAEGLPVLGPREFLGEFSFDARSVSGLTRNLTANPPTRELALTLPIALEVGVATPTPPAPTDQDAIDLAHGLFSPEVIAGIPLEGSATPTRSMPALRLAGGNDGQAPIQGTYAGDEVGFADYQNNVVDLPRNGLLAFQAVEDISIVAAPAASSSADNVAIQGAVIGHCEYMRYRIAVLDTPADQLPTQALDYRNITSSTHAALYYPWLEVSNPVDGSRLRLPPSGFVAGIYARNDIQRAVFKAPANEVIRSAVDLELRLNRAQQELLNPEGVNCLRYFAGRGFLVWGARTISDDPEWKYVNLRRYFAYLEHSIDRSTQWVVFEVNSERLWDNVRRTVEDFLFNEWKTGALLGEDPKQAYFVRCDRSTMTQNDLDNGRLVCLIGVAAVRPAEFVIFRIGQWTAAASQ